MAPRSLVMPKPIDGSPIGAGEAAPVLEAVLDHRHVREAHRGAVAVGDHEVAEALDVDRLALGAHVHLALRALDAAGGHLEVLARDRAVHVRDGQALGLEPHRVVPDAHVAVAEAARAGSRRRPAIVWSCGRITLRM